MTQPAPGFDARPLQDPVDAHAVGAFAAELRARSPQGVSGGTIVGIIVGVVFVVFFLPILWITGFGLAFSGEGSALFAVPVVLILAVLVSIPVFLLVSRRRRRITQYRLHRFAQANGMSYEPKVVNPPLPGMIFSLGSARTSTDLVRGTQPRFVEFGNYQYTVQSGKNSTTYRWGYIAVKLDVPLPNIVLDARGNNTFGSNLPASFRRDQRLSLEGDFDRYFDLYCPEGYERDALYLFSPDIMARFVDNAAELDAEIVDDWLFLYTQRRVSTLDPATWAWLFGAVGAVLSKIDQWARWRDERLLAENPTVTASALAGPPMPRAGLPFAPPVGMLTPPPGVAMQGRRLKRRFSWIPIVIAVLIGALWIWMRTLG